LYHPVLKAEFYTSKDDPAGSIVGMLKKAASGVLAILPCSRTKCTLRASKWLWPCWTTSRLREDMLFEHSRWLLMLATLWTFWGYLREIFHRPMVERESLMDVGNS